MQSIFKVPSNRTSVSINIYKQVYPPHISYEINIPQAPLAVADKPSLSFYTVVQDSGTAYRVPEMVQVHGPTEERVIRRARRVQKS